MTDKIIKNNSIKTQAYLKNLQPNKMDFMFPNKTLRTTQYALFNVKSKRISFQVGTYLNINS